ncbi:MAG TPA: hypothetical protein VGJ26_19830 [Pirellulales bacterium]
MAKGVGVRLEATFVEAVSTESGASVEAASSESGVPVEAAASAEGAATAGISANREAGAKRAPREHYRRGQCDWRHVRESTMTDHG